MAIKWAVEISGTDFFDRVINIVFDMGRPTLLDDYSGNACKITVRNNDGYFDTIGISSVLRIYPVSTFGSGEPIGATRTFWFQSAQYQDQIDSDASTATLIFTDGYGLLGQTPISENTSNIYSALGTVTQSDQYITRATALAVAQGGMFAISTMNKTSGAPVPAYSIGSSAVPTLGASGVENINSQTSILDYINLNTKTEQTSFDVPTINFGTPSTPNFYTCVYLVGRSKMDTQKMAVSIGASPSSTSLVWDQLGRDQYGFNFYNQVTLNWVYSSARQVTSTGSNVANGFVRLDQTTREGNFAGDVSNGLTQATYHSQYLANALNTFENTYMTLSFIDAGQNVTALSSFLSYDALVTRYLTIQYLTPSTGLISKDMKIEGVNVQIEAGLTRFTLTLSDYDLYNFFTLNSTSSGILNTSRLGW